MTDPTAPQEATTGLQAIATVIARVVARVLRARESAGVVAMG